MFRTAFDRIMMATLLVLGGAALAPVWWVGVIVGGLMTAALIAWNPDAPSR